MLRHPDSPTSLPPTRYIRSYITPRTGHREAFVVEAGLPSSALIGRMDDRPTLPTRAANQCTCAGDKQCAPTWVTKEVLRQAQRKDPAIDRVY